MARDITSAKAAFGESDRAWREVGGRAVGAAKSAHLSAPPPSPPVGGGTKSPHPSVGPHVASTRRRTRGTHTKQHRRGSSTHLRSVAILVAHAARHDMKAFIQKFRGLGLPNRSSASGLASRSYVRPSRARARAARSVSRSAAVCLSPALLCSLPVAKAGATPHRRGPS